MKLLLHPHEMMEKNIVLLHEKLNEIYNFFHKKVQPCLSYGFEYLVFKIHPYWHHLFYYILVSVLGYISLRGTKQISSSSNNPQHHDLDLFFTSVSAATISSMSTIEMENFSSTQLMILVLLMFSGGEVFISLLGLQIRKLKHKKRARNHVLNPSTASQGEGIKYKSLRALNHVILGYLLVSHILGYVCVFFYISIMSPSASNVLESKKLEIHLFSLFVTVSTIANCGFIPTNENMIPFNTNSGLLLILIPQILMGNKLYPCCLRLIIWVLEKFTGKEEYSYMLKNHADLGYGLLISGYKAFLLIITAVGLVMIQFLVFCILEWNSLVFKGQNWYQKFVGSLFQTVNSRHSGESIVDFSLLSPATLVLFVVMMYLPSSTIFVPLRYDKESSVSENSNSSSQTKSSKRQESSIIENLKFSPLSYLGIFVILICITESTSLKEDSLNFSVFNIIVEVVSAYGNVGFSMGYSCKRRLQISNTCKDSWYGFVGHWSWKGKILLILVMLFGRLKRFYLHAGKAWKLSL